MKEQYRIAAKRSLTPEIGQISVEAPLIAAKAKAGQFIILRVDEAGERIPLTISSAQDGKVTVVYQKVGGTTLALDQLQEGDCLHDFVGPLGTPTHVEGYRRVAVLGGGLGCAIALPVAKAMKEAGAQVDLIGGFRSKDIVILVLYVVTGVVLGGAGVYQKLVDWAGSGATVPLTGFGYLLAKGVRKAVEEQGFLGALTGGVTAAAGGITAAIFFGFLVALLFKSKPKS